MMRFVTKGRTSALTELQRHLTERPQIVSSVRHALSVTSDYVSRPFPAVFALAAFVASEKMQIKVEGESATADDDVGYDVCHMRAF